MTKFARFWVVAAAFAVVSTSVVVGGPQPAAAEPQKIGEPFLISAIPADATHLTTAFGTYDHERDRFFVAMFAHPKSGTPWSVVTSLVGPDGRPIPGTQARVNADQALHDNPASPGYWRQQATVAFNPTTDEYLLVWAQGTGANSQAALGARWSVVYSQRISADTGQPVGSTVQVTAPRGTTAWCSVFDPVVEFNPADGGFLVALRYGIINGTGGDPACPDLPAGQAYRQEVGRLSAGGTLVGDPVVVPGSGSTSEDGDAVLVRHPVSGEFVLAYRYSRAGLPSQTNVLQRFSAAGQPIGGEVAIDPQLLRESAWLAPRPDGNWLVLGYIIGGAVKAFVYSPTLDRIGERRDVVGPSGVTHFLALGDGTFVMRDVDSGYLYQLGPTGVPMGARFSAGHGDAVLVGRAGAPTLVFGRGNGDFKNTMTGVLVTYGPGKALTGGGIVHPSTRRCIDVAGAPGDVALVNLTPVEAQGPGFGQLVSSDIVTVPEASNVNFGIGSVDPNVAAAPIGVDAKVCYANSANTRVHIIADHLGTIVASAITLATPTGAPDRKVDTRIGVGGGLVGPSGRVCFGVAGAPGDVALVNLTPVEAQGLGFGSLVSSDIVTAPDSSNVNFRPGSVDPNVAAAPIGADGKVCYVNSVHTNVHLIADHLGTVSKSAITLATTTGAPERKVDTRIGIGGGLVGPNGRVCFAVAGAPGDVALVNLTPVEAQGLGFGSLVSSDIATAPNASNVNYGFGSVDPNVAAAPIGADGKVCYANSDLTSVHIIADHLGTISKSAYKLATPSGAPTRRIDTRGTSGGIIISS